MIIKENAIFLLKIIGNNVLKNLIPIYGTPGAHELHVTNPQKSGKHFCPFCNTVGSNDKNQLKVKPSMNICHTDKPLSVSEQLPIKIALVVESGRWQVQGLPGLQSEFKASLENLVKPYLETKYS